MQNDDLVTRKFSEGIKSLREKRNWTQEELAEKSEISYKNIQYLESKEPTCPSLITINKLAKAFNITVSQLLKL